MVTSFMQPAPVPLLAGLTAQGASKKGKLVQIR